MSRLTKVLPAPSAPQTALWISRALAATMIGAAYWAFVPGSDRPATSERSAPVYRAYAAKHEPAHAVPFASHSVSASSSQVLVRAARPSPVRQAGASFTGQPAKEARPRKPRRSAERGGRRPGRIILGSVHATGKTIRRAFRRRL